MMYDARHRFDRLGNELVKLDKKRERKMRQIKTAQEKIEKLKKKKGS